MLEHNYFIEESFSFDVREPIEVRVEKDKIEILSFPGPDL